MAGLVDEHHHGSHSQITGYQRPQLQLQTGWDAEYFENVSQQPVLDASEPPISALDINSRAELAQTSLISGAFEFPPMSEVIQAGVDPLSPNAESSHTLVSPVFNVLDQYPVVNSAILNYQPNLSLNVRVSFLISLPHN